MIIHQSPPQLAIDIGNTDVKAAVLGRGGVLEPVLRLKDHDWSAIDGLITNHGVKNILYSSVANVLPNEWVEKWKTEGCFVLALSPEVALPFRSRYQTMDTLGQDRIAAVAGSLALPLLPPSPGGGEPAPAAAPTEASAKLIVDAGTCVTLDLIDGEGTYHGGNISPGLRMRLRAMHAFTARLPALEPAGVTGRVGDTTAAALRHGAQQGLVYEIEGLYARLAADFPGLQLLLTGGDAPWLRDRLSIPAVFCPHLVLRGLHLILSNYVTNES